MGKQVLLVFVGVLIATGAKAQDLPGFVQNSLRLFTTDGCSQSEDGAWKHCCVAHDIWYWKGGTSEQKKAADQELRSCMVNAGASASLAQQYYVVTRVAGVFLQSSKYRWGNGWKYVRPQIPWSPLEAEQIEMLEPTLDEAMGLKLDGSTGSPQHLPSITGNLCMDIGIYEILEAAKKVGVSQIHVNKMIEAQELGGKEKYLIGLKSCDKLIELPLKVSASYCQGKKTSIAKAQRIFNLRRLQSQVDQCFK